MNSGPARWGAGAPGRLDLVRRGIPHLADRDRYGHRHGGTAPGRGQEAPAKAGAFRGYPQRRHGTGVFRGHGDCLLAAAFQRPALAGAWPAGDRAPERARRPVQLRQADRGRGQFSRRRPGRVPGYPGVSPRRRHLRTPGSGCPLRGRPDLAACPPRRHQADRARRNTKINRRVRAGTVTGCRDARNKQPDTARITQL